MTYKIMCCSITYHINTTTETVWDTDVVSICSKGKRQMWRSASIGSISIVSVKKKSAYKLLCVVAFFFRVYMLFSTFQFLLWCKDVPYKLCLVLCYFHGSINLLVRVLLVASLQCHSNLPTN